MKITKEELQQIIKEEIEAVLNEEERLAPHQIAVKIDASRDLCRRLRDLGWSVEWDQTKSMRQQDTPDERAKSCQCGVPAPGTERGPDGKLKGVDYFDPKDPAQKKACLGF